MFEIGDEVLVVVNNQLLCGRVASVISTYVANILGREYGVKFEDTVFLRYFKEEDLSAIPRLSVTTCDCGAEAAHYPDKPPGHSNWCTKGTYV